MIDTHCHLTYPELNDRLGEVFDHARSRGVTRMITIGTTPSDSAEALRIASIHPHVYATAGIHPHHSERIEDLAAAHEELESLLEHPRIVAIGEMGLDTHYKTPTLESQLPVLDMQLDLAVRHPDLPVVIHNRETTELLLERLGRRPIEPSRIIFHCFTGEERELDAILDYGAYVGLTGIVTFHSARMLARAADRIPMDRLLIETDSPYLTPEPNRKVRPNQPGFVADVAGFLAERRKMELDAFIAGVDENARRVFKLPD
ncbi:MAG: TatD family hydrolase [Phycisphaeraceae bacterium]|nr:TatD family hydrolase [Phycisphaeraceae bacterium]